MVAAILVFLALLATSLLHVSRFLGRSADVARVTAGNAAYSGTQYALSRLSRNPIRPAGARKADSWFVTPAYTHGEPYEDLDGDGAWGAGEPYIDADGDGQADLYTGRLRSSGTWDCRFLLDLNGALLSVNSGFPYLLNMLGAVLGEREPEDIFGEYVAPTGTGEEIYLSDLGTRIVAARPPVGYLSLGEVKERVGLTDREWAILSRYLTLSQTQPSFCLNGTPAELLEATYRYRVSRGKGHQFPNLPTGTDPHTGLAFSDVVVLAREEAASLGREIARRARDDPFESWDAFWQFLDGNRETLFPYPEIGGGAERAAFQRVRALLAFWNGNPNPSPYVGIETGSPKGAVRASVPSWTWGRWPQANEPRSVGANYFIKNPPYMGDQPYDGVALNDAWGVPGRHLGVPTRWSVSSAGEAADATQRLSAASEDGEFETARTLYLTSQEDFENLTAQVPPWGAGTPRTLGNGVLAEGWGTMNRVTSLPQFPKDAFDSGPAYDTPFGALTLSAYPNIPGGLIPPPDIAVRFDQTAPPPPDTAWEDNVTEQQTGKMLSLAGNALDGNSGNGFGRAVSVGGDRKCEVYPFWTFTCLGNLASSDTSWYFEADEFPGRDDAVLHAGSGILTEIRSLEQATVECWVTELDPPEKNAAIWALRAGYPGGAKKPPSSGLLLRRDGGGRYQLLWHGPYFLWYEEDFSHIWGETLLASWRPPEWQAWEDNPIANPYPVPRMRQVTLVLNHNRADPAASRPLLYVDGIEATAAGWIDEFGGTGSYPVPLRWTRSGVWKLGPLIDPEEPWIINPTWNDWWSYVADKFPLDDGFPGSQGTSAGQVCMSLQCDEFFLWKSVLPAPAIAGRAIAPRFQTSGGSFRSPRYTLPEDARPILASWTGVQTASALTVTLNGHTAGGAPAFPPRTIPAGAQSLFSSDETNEAGLRALDFTVTWGSTSGPAGRLDPSVFEDLLVQYAPRSGPRRLR